MEWIRKQHYQECENSLYIRYINHFDYHITSQLSRCSQSPASYHLFTVLTLDAFPQFHSAVYSIRFPESLELLLSMVWVECHIGFRVSILWFISISRLLFDASRLLWQCYREGQIFQLGNIMLEMLGQEVSFVVLPTLIGSCWYTGSMSSARPCSVYQSWKEDKIEQIVLQLLPKILLRVPSEPQLVDYLRDNPINILGRQDRFFNKTERLEQRRNLLSLIDSYVQVIEFYRIYHLLIYITHPDDSISIIF